MSCAPLMGTPVKDWATDYDVSTIGVGLVTES